MYIIHPLSTAVCDDEIARCLFVMILSQQPYIPGERTATVEEAIQL